VQLNSNGLRLSEDAGFARALAQAGLSFVFMQFDGVDDTVYLRLRGRQMRDVKLRAIAACAAHNLGVVLVPTVVPHVNAHQLGSILRLAVSLSPAVRGVHFQPVAYLGRMPAPPSDDQRLTLDQLLAGLYEQAAGLLAPGSLRPSRCDHPLCGFHGDFVVTSAGALMPLAAGAPAACCGAARAATAEQNRRFVARRWQRPATTPAPTANADLRDLEAFRARVANYGFTVTAMAFQDAGTLDTDRMRHCSLHVFANGRMVPFCAYYLSPLEAP
jgi:7,8-dihydro-6-hydroxymethylpterin dimethyltransferase